MHVESGFGYDVIVLPIVERERERERERQTDRQTETVSKLRVSDAQREKKTRSFQF